MKRICAIDVSGIFRQHWHSTEHEDQGAAVRKTLQAVTGFAAGFDIVAICVDTPPYKRSEISPEYKAHREKAPAVMYEQMAHVIKKLGEDGFHVMGAKGYEADDIIATICEWQRKNAGKVDGVVVVSSDKDLLALVRPGVEVISAGTGTVYANEEAVKAKLGVMPSQVASWIALVGDKSDGIPGIYGVGPKRAAEWLARHGDVEQVILNADKIEPERFRADVNAGKDIILKSYILARLLKDAPINPEDLLTTKEPVREMPTPTIEDDAEPSPMPPPSMTTAMVPVEYERALEPRDSNGAVKLAHHLFNSRMFGQFPTPEAILSIVLAGRAYGLGAFQSLQGFHNIKGKPCASAQLIVGLVKRHPACRYFRLVESTDKSCTYETHREGEPEPTRMTYTIEMAQIAGLIKKDNWANDPGAMLLARASARLARAVYQDIVGGLLTPDEAE